MIFLSLVISFFSLAQAPTESTPASPGSNTSSAAEMGQQPAPKTEPFIGGPDLPHQPLKPIEFDKADRLVVLEELPTPTQNVDLKKVQERVLSEEEE